MKNATKKILALLVVLATVCLSFASCDFFFEDAQREWEEWSRYEEDLSRYEEDLSRYYEQLESQSVSDSRSESHSYRTGDEYVIPGPGKTIDLKKIPAYNGQAYIALDDNIPSFGDVDMTTESFEYYSPLDALGRCGYTVACVGRDIMPTEARGSIGTVKPTGWQTAKYDCVDGKYLYNRCHLIGFQLTGENANKQNLITGTRYLNIDGMLDFENMVADYVKETGNHVLYRVEPIFDGNNPVAAGVHMEGWSVEDNGDGVCFNVFSYNVQPGVVIDYKTGLSHLAGDEEESSSSVVVPTETVEENYILNTSTKKFHTPECSSAPATTSKNRVDYLGSREDLIEGGYSPCSVCKP